MTYICAVLGIFYILLFYLLGNIVSVLTGRAVSGSVIGMVLLFAALHFKMIKPQSVRGTSKFLLDNMALLFVPPGVGLMVSYALVEEHLWAIIVSGAVSTVIVILAVGWIQQKLGQKL